MKSFLHRFNFSTSIFFYLVIFFTSFFILFFYLNFKILSKFSQTSIRCVFYDRPPRTASTTISKALTNCLIQKNYTIHKRASKRNHFIYESLALPGTKKAVVSKHVLMNQDDVDTITNSCNHLLYITSTRPMKGRLSSHAIGMLTIGHGNATIDSQTYQKAMKNAANTIMKGKRTKEAVLESYPFRNRTLIDPLTMINPDYVIRYNHLNQDMSKLLKSLDCPPNAYNAENVHTVQGRDQLDNLHNTWNLTLGDETFLKLDGFANYSNPKGLRKAKSF